MEDRKACGSDIATVELTMGRGDSVELVTVKRQNYSATVKLELVNDTEHVLDVRKDWVKGGEAVVKPVS